MQWELFLEIEVRVLAPICLWSRKNLRISKKHGPPSRQERVEKLINFTEFSRNGPVTRFALIQFRNSRRRLSVEFDQSSGEPLVDLSVEISRQAKENFLRETNEPCRVLSFERPHRAYVRLAQTIGLHATESAWLDYETFVLPARSGRSWRSRSDDNGTAFEHYIPARALKVRRN